MRASKHAVIMALMLLVPQFLLSQTDRGTIRGTVNDPSGAVVGGAKVEAVNVATGVRTATTSTGEGNYNIPNLIAGLYRVEVEGPGFKKLIRDNVRVNAGVVVALDLQLSIGETSESVTVTTESPQLEKESSDLRTTINPQAFADLPLVSGTGRNPTTLALLSPGTRQGGNSLYGGFYTSFNGGQILSGEVELDGLSVNYPPAPGQPDAIVSIAPEAMQEVSIISGPSAETRGSTGVTRYAIRSGTNEFHGNLYEFLRNDKLDANTFFRNRQGLGRVAARRNEFGGSLGGPVRIPKVWKGTDKSFFFVNLQGFRLRQTAATSTVSVPTEAFKRGDFSALKDSNGRLIPIYDPLTTRSDGKGGQIRDPFPGNIIPANRISTVSKNFLPQFPDPNLPGFFNNFLGASPGPTDLNSFTTKFDHRFTSSHSLSFTWSMFNREATAGSIFGRSEGPGNPDTVSFTNIRTGRLAHDWTIKPNLINHAIFGYNRRNSSGLYRGVTEGAVGKLGLSPAFDAPGRRCGVSAFFNTGAAGVFGDIFASPYYRIDGGADPSSSDIVNNYLLNDGLSWVKGKHNWKFGGEARVTRLDFGTGAVANCPGFNFSGARTGFPTNNLLDPSIPAGQQALTSGDSFATFLLGGTDGAGIGRDYAPTRNPRWHYYAGYVQDDVKLRPNLTLNLGLRWDFWLPVFEKWDRYQTMDPTVPNPGAGGLPGAMIFAGTGPGLSGHRSFAFGSDGQLGQKAYRNFTPHLGFAWSVKPNLVIRSGFGMEYFPNIQYGSGDFRLLDPAGGAFASSISVGAPDPWTPGYYWDQPFTLALPGAPTLSPTVNNGKAALTMYPTNYRPPFMEQWNLNIQYEFAKNWMLDVAYVGNKGSRLASGMANWKQIDPKYLALGNLLLRPIDDPAVVALGFKPPWPGFVDLYKPLRGGASPTLLMALQPFPQYTNIWFGSNNATAAIGESPLGNSTYHALQTKLQKQISQGLFVLTSFTWSKKITDADSSWGGFNSTSTRDSFNHQLEKAISPSNPPRRLTTAFNYELPIGPGKRFANGGGAIGKVVGGWQINGIVTYQTGIPIVVAIANGNNLTIGSHKNMPNVVPGQEAVAYQGGHFDPATDRYLNLNAFAIPANFTIGNAPAVMPNSRDFALLNEDFSIMKRTTIKEKVNLEFRMEMFNVFNRVRFATPNTNFDNPAYGTVGGQANSPRTIQFALKLNF